MPPRLPVVSGKTLVKFLQKSGFVVARQKGSHVQMVKTTPAGRYTLTVPLHREIAKGTLNDILSHVATLCQVPKDHLLRDLADF